MAVTFKCKHPSPFLNPKEGLGIDDYLKIAKCICSTRSYDRIDFDTCQTRFGLMLHRSKEGSLSLFTPIGRWPVHLKEKTESLDLVELEKGKLWAIRTFEKISLPVPVLEKPENYISSHSAHVIYMRFFLNNLSKL